MSKAAMEALLDIADWYASLSRTFIYIYNMEKPLNVLSNFALDKLVMQEVSCRILTGLSAKLHRKKKAPWLTLPLWIRLYEIHKHAYVKVEEIKEYPFEAQTYILYDSHFFVKDHCVRVHFRWIHEACRWLDEDPWRYCHSLSKPNELVGIIVEWLAKNHPEEDQQ